jgi:hypothetical protein
MKIDENHKTPMCIYENKKKIMKIIGNQLKPMQVNEKHIKISANH